MICKDKENFTKPLKNACFCCVFVARIINDLIIKIKCYDNTAKSTLCASNEQEPSGNRKTWIGGGADGNHHETHKNRWVSFFRFDLVPRRVAFYLTRLNSGQCRLFFLPTSRILDCFFINDSSQKSRCRQVSPRTLELFPTRVISAWNPKYKVRWKNRGCRCILLPVP